MEALLAIVIVCIAALGLGASLIMGRSAPQRSCDGLACVGGVRCDGCPNKDKEAK